MNQELLSIIQIVSSLLLVGLILLQAKGTGLGAAFGGETMFYRTKRGAEKLIFAATVTLSVIFLLTSLLRVLL